MLPKEECDVEKVEIKRVLKLTTKMVQPISFTVPRTRVRAYKPVLEFSWLKRRSAYVE